MKTDALEEKLKIKFKNPALLARALVHRSYLNEVVDSKIKSNERLEFLGDAILSFVISDWLFHDFTDFPEGKLTNLRSNIVCTTALAQIGEKLEIGEHLLMSKGERESNGHQNPVILANTVEAIIGALFLDQGIEIVRKFIKENFASLIQEIIKRGELKDAKSLLQEKLQAKVKATPVYKTLQEEGPDHDKTFIVGVYVNEKLLAQGKGKSKQEAEEKAAENALEE